MATLPNVMQTLQKLAFVILGRQNKLARILEAKLPRSRTMQLARQVRSSSPT